MTTKFRRVYVVSSLAQEDYMIFGTNNRAQKFIDHFDPDIFEKSTPSDLYICSRVVF